MKILKLAMFFCAIGFYSAQDYLFTYETKFKTDSLQKEQQKMLYTLDVSKKEVKFYPTACIENDSIYRKDGSQTYMYLDGIEHKLKRKIGSDEYTNYHSQSPHYYAVKTTDAPQKWTIENETKTIGNHYKVRKAVTNFGGRSWVAWFSEEIPIPEGPYKFRGLPGLILEVYDTKGNFFFQIKEVKKKKQEINTEYFLENLYSTKPLNINEKQWTKQRMDYFLNPGKDYDSGKILVVDEKGNTKELQMNGREETLSMQEFLRKHNNPIELNKAMKYPAK